MKSSIEIRVHIDQMKLILEQKGISIEPKHRYIDEMKPSTKTQID